MKITRFKSSVLIATTALTTAGLVTGSVFATDFTVNTATTTTNDGNAVNAGDSVTVTSSGAITTMGADRGLQGFGGTNTFFNQGSITTSGGSAAGIEASGGNSTSNNSGSITTAGGVAPGIRATGNNNTSINVGSITTTGNGALGFWVVGDNNTTNSSGSITTSGNGSVGLYTDGDNNTNSNSGSITTSGNGSAGLDTTGDNSTNSNSGSIATSGGVATGIRVNGDNSTSINSGSISTTGSGSLGIWVVGDNNTTNSSGSIATLSLNGIGIFSDGNNNTASSSGSITTSGLGGMGISAEGDNNTLSNSGTIATSGTTAYGLYAFGNNNTLGNSGTIATSGPTGYGLYAIGNTNTANVSGSVVSQQSAAVRFNGTTNSLNLTAPAYIGGAFDLGTNTTLNLTSGPSHSVLWHFDPTQLAAGSPTLSGSVPWFVSIGTGPGPTDQYATYDPSGLAGQTDALGDMTALISDATGQADCGSGVWVSAFGGKVKHTGNDRTLGREIDQGGVAAGCDWQQSPTLRVGFKAGLIQSDTSAASRFTKSLSADAKGAFVGVSGSGEANLGLLGEVGLGFQVNAARLSHSQDRFVNNNLSTTGGLTLGHGGAKSEFNSWFIAPEISMTRDLATYSGWDLGTDSSLRYSLQSIDEMAEVSTDVAARVKKRRVSVLETQSEIQATRPVPAGTFTAKLGLLNRYAGGDDATVTMFGQTHQVSAGDVDQTSVYVGAGLNLDLAGGKLALNGRAFTGGDMGGYQGAATFKLAF